MPLAFACFFIHVYLSLCLQACNLNDREVWVYGSLGKFSFPLCCEVLKWLEQLCVS